ncbi:uncharacterized protein BJ171DRAFT_476182 [Polychytrium aggregatum]|uniref:uncharacterized protein n=1 Tax=Polychytrium aggregatum TaxID=110093 RepID=UPI0022FF2526|nr:uncharacterized protein BJ171DRAFT_476182 [Polychytrium aggregatum]KAI9202953.1 hypothetical protein BJ171DRAFT_476182 [Polychytrium aggregatum]
MCVFAIYSALPSPALACLAPLCGLTEGDMDKLDFSVGIKVRIRDIQAAMRQPLPGSPNPSTPDHNTATGPSNTAIVTSNTAIVTSNDGSSAVQPPSEPNLVRSAPPLDPATQSGSPSPPAAQSSSTPPTAQSGPAPPVAQSGESAPEHNVVQAYIPLNIVSNWQCMFALRYHSDDSPASQRLLIRE